MIFPNFVLMNGSCLVRSGNTYFRDAGAWEVHFIEQNGKLFVNELSGPMSHCHGKEIVECTEAEWRKDNEGYV